MRPEVYIFDFDGTLVHSDALKKEAYFGLSEDIAAHPEIVREVLHRFAERSRFETIREIYSLLGKHTGKEYDDQTIQEAVAAYSSSVLKSVLACPELEGASSLLAYLKKINKKSYISSNTPEETLATLIQARQWNQYIESCFGFPSRKSDTIRYIYNLCNVTPEKVIVIGNGVSDEEAAKENGCHFFKITHDKSLREFHASLDRSTRYV